MLGVEGLIIADTSTGLMMTLIVGDTIDTEDLEDVIVIPASVEPAMSRFRTLRQRWLAVKGRKMLKTVRHPGQHT